MLRQFSRGVLFALGFNLTIFVWERGIYPLVCWRSCDDADLYYTFLSVLFGIMAVLALTISAPINFPSKPVIANLSSVSRLASAPIALAWGSTWAESAGHIWADQYHASSWCWIAGVVLALLLVICRYAPLPSVRCFAIGAGCALLVIFAASVGEMARAGTVTWNAFAVLCACFLGTVVVLRMENLFKPRKK